MLKTIKTTKHMRLDELIKYIFDNDIKDMYFYRKEEKSLFVNRYGEIVPEAHFGKNDLFPVEIEQEIKEDTEFEAYAIVSEGDIVLQYNTCMSVGKIMEFIKYDEPKELHAVINGKLQLIWESEE